MEYLTPGFKKYISSLRDLPGFEEVNTKLGEGK
jgi:hypothetical protein